MINLKEATFNDVKIFILKNIQSYIFRFLYHDFGKKSVIESPLIIRNKKKISIGKNVTIRKNARIEVVTKYNNIIYNPSLIIGDNVTIEYNIHLTCAYKIIIEDNVLIGGYVTIVDNNHGYLDVTKSIQSNNLTEPKEVVIGNESFIGMGARIMPGVHIGKHCTIGANSVVNINIPDYSVAVGNPVKIVKKYNFITNRWEKTNEKGAFLIV